MPRCWRKTIEGSSERGMGVLGNVGMLCMTIVRFMECNVNKNYTYTRPAAKTVISWYLVTPAAMSLSGAPMRY